MADLLTAEDRALIAAFPPERVQVIPRGVTGEATFMYDPLANGQLRSSHPIGWRDTIARECLAAKRGRHNAKRRRAVQARRCEVEDLHDMGQTIEQISARLGVSPQTITHDLRAVRGVAL